MYVYYKMRVFKSYLCSRSIAMRNPFHYVKFNINSRNIFTKQAYPPIFSRQNGNWNECSNTRIQEFPCFLFIFSGFLSRIRLSCLCRCRSYVIRLVPSLSNVSITKLKESFMVASLALVGFFS